MTNHEDPYEGAAGASLSSVEAAQRSARQNLTHRSTILAAARAAGDRGVTSLEIRACCLPDVPVQLICARLHELRGDRKVKGEQLPSLLARTGTRRQHDGRSADVHVLTDAGAAAAAELVAA